MSVRHDNNANGAETDLGASETSRATSNDRLAFADSWVGSTVRGSEVRVTVSGDEFQGQPELRVLLDGKPIGGIRVTARHDLGEWTTLSFSAPRHVDPKRLELRFVEDAYAEHAGTVIGDRNLWVAKVEVNGKSIDALAGHNATVDNAGEPGQAHGYVMPRAGTLSFDLSTLGVPREQSGGVSPFQQGRFEVRGPGSTIEGRTGSDVAVFRGKSTDYQIALQPDGSIRVTDVNRLDGDDGSTTLDHIRWAAFGDRTLDLGGVWLAQQLAKTPIDAAFYVGPDGADTNPGTRERPFATLEKAVAAARADASVETIYVKPGDYWFPDRPLELTAADSGLRIVGLGGEGGSGPVLHGGFEIRGFERVAGEGTSASGIWRAQTPVGETVGLDLTMNGARVLPAMPGNRSADIARDWLIGGKVGGAGDFIELADSTLNVPVGSYAQVFSHHWRWQDDLFKVIDVAVGDDGRTLVQLDRAPTYYDTTNEPVVFRLLGHAEFVADHPVRPGQPEFGWSSDRGLVLDSGQNAPPEKVVAAQQASILRLHGAHDVTLHGLTFADTLTPSPKQDASELNSVARWLDQAALSLHDADNLLVGDSVFQNVGRAISLHDSSSARILGNAFVDLGREGVKLRGDSDGVLIAGNRFDDVGEVLVGYAAVDLLSAGEVDHATIAHDTVTDAGGRAITMGDESVYGRMYGTRITGNHIEHIGTQAGDAGGIHVFAQHSIADSGTRIEGNIIRDIEGIVTYQNEATKKWEFVDGRMGDGIYVDVAMHDTIVRHNLVDNVSSAAVHVFGSRDTRILDNYAFLDRTGGEPEWKGDKFLYLHERVLSVPVAFWHDLPSPLPQKISVEFSIPALDYYRDDLKTTIWMNSIEINGVNITVPDDPEDPQVDPNNRYAWIEGNGRVEFELAGLDIPNSFEFLDPMRGTFLSSADNTGKDLVVLHVGYADLPHLPRPDRLEYVDFPHPPKFKIFLGDETTPIFQGEVPETPTIDGAEVLRNVVSQQSILRDDTRIANDYIRYLGWNVRSQLENDSISVDNNLLFNTQRYTGEDAAAHTARGFTQDHNSRVVDVAPLVPDDSARGYSLDPRVARTARELGIQDLGSKGLDLWSKAGIDGFDWRTYGGSLDRPAPLKLPPSAEGGALTQSVDGLVGGVAPSQLVLDADADARIVFVDETAGLRSVLGAYLIEPDGRIGPVGILFPEIEHRDPDPRFGPAVRPGGGPLAPGDSVLLSEIFPAGSLHEGQSFRLFLASGAVNHYGKGIFAPGAGTFAFVDPAGGQARLSSVAPALVFEGRDGRTTAIDVDIFHTARGPGGDPLANLSNDGGREQVISGRAQNGDLEIRFEDLRIAGSADRDFNDLIVRVDIV